MSTPIVIANFPITEDVGLRKYGSHFDIGFEIANHGRRDDYFGREPRGTWCYYVTVSEQMLEPDEFAEFWLKPSSTRVRSNGWAEPTYDYCGQRFSRADWHGGVTFYEKRGGIDGEARLVKIGCDFAHYWDEGREFDLDGVTFEAKQTVERLREMYAFKRRCVYTGIWLPEHQMIVGEGGRLYSPEGKASSDKFRAEREAAAKATGSAS